MHFLISGQVLNVPYLVAVGFVIGVLGGFFGVGGSFLAGPALYAVGVPMHYVVGTDLAHIVGKSIVAARRHRALGNIDFKLGLFMVIGTIIGVEAGAQLIERLKKTADVDVVVGGVLFAVLVLISGITLFESVKTARRNGAVRRGGRATPDESAFAHLTRRLHAIRIPPMVSLPVSGVPSISLWLILAVSCVGGFFSGFLGGGAGYIRMPSMVYLLGIPTHIAVGTDLFEIIISASYGTFTHALKGNVDVLIALVMHTGAALGARIGASLTSRFTGPLIRLAFVPLPLIGAGVLLWNLLRGAPGH